ncbi:hypothetical protein [Agrobacterium sp. FDAARGOS_525]|uniref:hypothetical protein n=1 Tax=Agrobacterium sp. FDAARGOS_525 TaxID=2420311 RepID=UPI000F676487|nr:hypothetical protein [Agrobacterium sp. FDAARGOS_525]
MSMNSEDRKRWLRGAYLGRIVEIAQHYAATRTYFIDANFVAFVAGEFEDLRDLSDDDRQYLRDQVGLESLRRVALSRARDREEIFGQHIADNDDVVARDAEFMFDIGWVSCGMLFRACGPIRRRGKSGWTAARKSSAAWCFLSHSMSMLGAPCQKSGDCARRSGCDRWQPATFAGIPADCGSGSGPRRRAASMLPCSDRSGRTTDDGQIHGIGSKTGKTILPRPPKF